MNEQSTGIRIYTDGAASPNPGPGGYGVVLLKDGARTELSGGFRLTTNNRMELLAVIQGLQALNANRTEATVFSDSKYVVDMVNGGYAARWRARGWMRNEHDRAENPDLWGQLLDACARHIVTFTWVRGHSANPNNERCDQLAVTARKGSNLPPDTGYEGILESRVVQSEFTW